MSADEQLLYDLHACYDGKSEWSKLVTLSDKNLHKLSELERGLTRRRDATCAAAALAPVTTSTVNAMPATIPAPHPPSPHQVPRLLRQGHRTQRGRRRQRRPDARRGVRRVPPHAH